MDKPRLFHVVKLKVSATGSDLGDGEGDILVPAGETGTTVHEFASPKEAWEIEVSNDYGETVAMLTLTADQLDVIWRAGKVVGQEIGA